MLSERNVRSINVLENGKHFACLVSDPTSRIPNHYHVEELTFLDVPCYMESRPVQGIIVLIGGNMVLCMVYHQNLDAIYKTPG